MIDGVFAVEDQLRDGDDGIAVFDERFQDRGQGLRCVQCGVMEQNDAAVGYFACDAVINRRGVVVLPIQTIPTGNRFNPPLAQQNSVKKADTLTKNCGATHFFVV